MSYEDFVWFILSEEDKSSDVSLDYWFRCVDLDCDGCLQPNEMLVSLLPKATPLVHHCIERRSDTIHSCNERSES